MASLCFMQRCLLAVVETAWVMPFQKWGRLVSLNTLGKIDRICLQGCIKKKDYSGERIKSQPILYVLKRNEREDFALVNA